MLSSNYTFISERYPKLIGHIHSFVQLENVWNENENVWETSSEYIWKGNG